MNSLPLTEFEQHIEQKVCSRGYEYYLQGRVVSIFNINGVEWQAIVQSVDDYVVQLKIEKDAIKQFECTCAEGHTGEICRHVVAVIYYINKDGSALSVNDSTGYEKIKDATSYFPAHVLRYIILKYAADSKSFREYLREYIK